MKTPHPKIIAVIFRYRHDIADALMVAAAILKFWPDPDTRDTARIQEKRKKRQRARKTSISHGTLNI